MAWGKKKDSLSLSEAQEVLRSPKELRGMSKKEVEDLKKRVRGEVSRSGDLKAGWDDFKKGRKGSQGVGGKLPRRPEGKGRSMWS